MAALTTNLRLELEKSNQAFGRWAENKQSWLETSSSAFSSALEECEHTLMALKENENVLETLREQNDVIKASQKEEVDYYIQQKAKLLVQRDELLPRLRKLEEEEEKETQRVEEIRKEYDGLRAQAERTLDDLTHGVRMYSSLGLEFQKAQNQCMKFIFTLIDPQHPSKQFFFLMFVDDADQYQLVDCQPTLESSLCNKLMTNLNQDNDIGRFVVGMRRAFKQTLSQVR